MHRILIPAVLGLMLPLAACGSDDSPATTTPATTIPAQIANPASEFCIAQGGTLEIVDETDGQVGYCTLADGTRVEEWEYFRSETGNTQP
jgi:uncharacterized protein